MDIDSALHVAAARVTETHVVAILADGREIATPSTWYPVLQAASPAAREAFEVSAFGIHWPALDEDLGIDGMLSGTHG